MKIYNHILWVALVVLAVTFQVSAQLKLPVKSINGQDYYYYTVKSKETIYGISHKLQISQEEILRYNPTALSGLKNKQQLFFPVADFSKESKANQKIETVSIPDRTDFTHEVEKGETLYGLARMYGISVDEIMRSNPDVADGLKVGQVLKFSQGKQNSIFVTVKPGETLFSTAKKYNTSIENIMRDNPGVSPANFKSGSVIKITPNSAKPVKQEKIVTEFYPYEIKKGDTFYSIAREKNVSVSELMAANPGIDKLKKGKMLYIPVSKTDTVLVSPNADSSNSSKKAEEIYSNVHKSKEKGSINIALMLPYMLKSASPSKSARLFTEFYKGFLLAVDEVRATTSKRINIYTYDTENSLATVNALLQKSELKRMDLIFAPDNAAQISAIAKFGNDNNINVVNTFSTKSEEYMSNPRFFQVNIPHSYMDQKVMEWFDGNFDGYKIIFLDYADNESKEVLAKFKKHMKGRYKSREVNVSSGLSADALSAMLDPGEKYVFIPSSSSKKALTKVLYALKKVKEDRIDIDMALVGYPEWTTYTNLQSDFKKLDTYFYSRFFIDPSGNRAKNLDAKYHKWYGENMIYAAPKFGILGYDCGKFFLESYIHNNSDFNKRNVDFAGVQSDFNFERTSNWGGFVNKSLYFIHFTPYSSTQRTLK